MKILLLLPVTIALFSIMSFLPQDAHATAFTLKDQASCQGNPLFGVWNAVNSTCTVSSPAIFSTDSLDVKSGITLKITGTFELHGIIGNSGTIIVNPSASLNQRDFLNNLATGKLTNKGTITNTASITNANTGIITSTGTLTNTPSGTIANNGTLTNSGTFNNNGILDLDSGTTITFSGPSSFAGSLTNTGTFNLNSGSLVSLDSGTKLTILSGTFLVPSGVTVSLGSASVFTVNPGGNATVLGSLKSGGTINNSGIIKDKGFINSSVFGIGTFNNSGLLQLSAGDTIKFGFPTAYSGSFQSDSLNMNSGSSLILDSGTKFDISGDFIIPAGVTLAVTNGSIVTIDAGLGPTLSNSGTINTNGTFNNSGTIHNPGSISNLGVMHEFCNSVFTGNPVTGNPLVNSCTTVPVTFKTNHSDPLIISLNGTKYATPVTLILPKGSHWELSTTTPQVIHGHSYTFTSWSDGGAITHVITIPSWAMKTYQANFLYHQ